MGALISDNKHRPWRMAALLQSVDFLFASCSCAGRLQSSAVVKNLYAHSIRGSGRFPWRMKLQPTTVFWPGKSHGQRSLAGYSPRGCKELDTA